MIYAPHQVTSTQLFTFKAGSKSFCSSLVQTRPAVKVFQRKDLAEATSTISIASKKEPQTAQTRFQPLPQNKTYMVHMASIPRWTFLHPWSIMIYLLILFWTDRTQILSQLSLQLSRDWSASAVVSMRSPNQPAPARQRQHCWRIEDMTCVPHLSFPMVNKCREVISSLGKVLSTGGESWRILENPF